MTQEDYIEKYGEIEGIKRWKAGVYKREWKKRNKEKVRAYNQAHRAEIAAYMEKYRQAHIEEKSKYDKERYQANREERLRYQKEFFQTPYGRASYLVHAYKQKDHKQARDNCTLTAQWIVDNIFTKRCLYCGEEDWHKLGCDRINNNRPHTPQNVVCCCKKCNDKRNRRDFLTFAYSIGAKDSEGLILTY